MENGMALKSSAYAAAAAVALFGATAILDATPASARCRGSIVRGEMASGALQTLTEFSARSKWRAAVRARYGGSFSRWGVAENKNVDCKKGEPCPVCLTRLQHGQRPCPARGRMESQDR